MKTIKVEPNQTVYDLAVQHYGTAEAVSEILSNNPDLANDTNALIELSIDTNSQSAFRLDVAVRPGFMLRIDETSGLRNESIIKKITNDITTYETWNEQELSKKSSNR